MIHAGSLFREGLALLRPHSLHMMIQRLLHVSVHATVTVQCSGRHLPLLIWSESTTISPNFVVSGAAQHLRTPQGGVWHGPQDLAVFTQNARRVAVVTRTQDNGIQRFVSFVRTTLVLQEQPADRLPRTTCKLLYVSVLQSDNKRIAPEDSKH